ncbi:hypothetical protein WS89_31160 [Burkholderia sp. MSMB1072]|nr:hypothetical protein WS89_31160 [Burkholderia sp. MSMB1072]
MVAIVIDAVCIWFDDAGIAVVSQLEHAALLYGINQLMMKFHDAVPICTIVVGVRHDDFGTSGNITQTKLLGAR